MSLGIISMMMSNHYRPTIAAATEPKMAGVTDSRARKACSCVAGWQWRRAFMPEHITRHLLRGGMWTD